MLLGLGERNETGTVWSGAGMGMHKRERGERELMRKLVSAFLSRGTFTGLTSAFGHCQSNGDETNDNEGTSGHVKYK